MLDVQALGFRSEEDTSSARPVARRKLRGQVELLFHELADAQTLDIHLVYIFTAN